jgi:hypothetical protein
LTASAAPATTVFSGPAWNRPRNLPRGRVRHHRPGARGRPRRQRVPAHAGWLPCSSADLWPPAAGCVQAVPSRHSLPLGA